MDITEVRLHKVEGEEPVKAYASVTLDKQVVIGKIRLIDGDKGFFVAMPSDKGKDGRFHDVAFPITGELRAKMQDAVLKRYYEEAGA